MQTKTSKISWNIALAIEKINTILEHTKEELTTYKGEQVRLLLEETYTINRNKTTRTIQNNNKRTKKNNQQNAEILYIHNQNQKK